jgi:biopolymer transport protein ExbD
MDLILFNMENNTKEINERYLYAARLKTAQAYENLTSQEPSSYIQRELHNESQTYAALSQAFALNRIADALEAMVQDTEEPELKFEINNDLDFQKLAKTINQPIKSGDKRFR